MKIIVLLLIIMLFPLTAYSETVTCDIYKELCPSCEYSDYSYYRDEWAVVSSLDEYKENLGEDLFTKIQSVLEDYGVPRYYVYLALIESGGKADNKSHKGALGLWQLMPYITNHYGYKSEDRLDPIKSTEIAAKYLSKHIKKYSGDIRYVIAAYNAGSSNLDRLFSKHGKSFQKLSKYSYQSYALSRTVFSVILQQECE